MSGNIPIGGNNRIKPQINANVAGARTTHTRALGSNASIFSSASGWRPAARGVNPHDTQSMKANMYARMRAGANAHAMGRSFGGMTMNQQANGMSDMEKAMQYMAMAQMGISLGQGIADIVNAFRTDNGKVDGNNDDKKLGNAGNLGGSDGTKANAKTSKQLAAGVKAAKDGIASSVESLKGCNLGSIQGLNNAALTELKEYNIDLGLDLSGIKNVEIAGEIPTDAELEGLTKQAELVSANLKAATKGEGTLNTAGTRCAAELQTVETNLASIEAQLAKLEPNDPQRASLKHQKTTLDQQKAKLEAKQQAIQNALSDLTNIKAELEAVNGTLQTLAKTLPEDVKEYNKLEADLKEKEASEKKELAKLTQEVDNLIGEIANARRSGKIERKTEKLQALQAQISALKSLVSEHTNGDAASAVASADAALAKIDSISDWQNAEGATPVSEEKGFTPDQINQLNQTHGTKLEVGKETTIDGKKFEITQDGKLKLDGNPVDMSAFAEALKNAQSVDNMIAAARADEGKSASIKNGNGERAMVDIKTENNTTVYELVTGKAGETAKKQIFNSEQELRAALRDGGYILA